MAVLRFTSLIKLRERNPYILVTRAQASSVKANWRKPLPVLVRIYFGRLKSPEARGRNLERALYVLSGNRGRFMARAWNQGA